MTDPTMLHDRIWHLCPFYGCPSNTEGFRRKALLDKHLDQYHFNSPVKKQRNDGRSSKKHIFTCPDDGCKKEFPKKFKLERHLNVHRIKGIRQGRQSHPCQPVKDIHRDDEQKPPVAVTTEVKNITECPVGLQETQLASNEETAEDSGYLDDACVADGVSTVMSNGSSQISSSKSNTPAAPHRTQKMLNLPEEALHDIHCRLERSDLEAMMLLNATFRDYITLHSDELPLRRVHLAMMSRTGLYIQLKEATSDTTTFRLDWTTYLDDEALGKFSSRLDHSFVETMQLKNMAFKGSVIDVLADLQDLFCVRRLQYVDVVPTSRTRFTDFYAYFANVDAIDLSGSPKLNSIVTTGSIEDFIGCDKSTVVLPRCSKGNSLEDATLLAFCYQDKTSDENKLSTLEVYASSMIRTTFAELFIRAADEAVNTRQCPSTLLKIHNPPPQDLRAYRRHLKVFADGLYTLSKGDIRITYSAAAQCLQCHVNPLYK
ncbi:hypothetical protein AAVH_06548 [Aphelenchoides avenae]|nr:hypothetical protein AAVH_06548 [Aphelenchus avenae]